MCLFCVLFGEVSFFKLWHQLHEVLYCVFFRFSFSFFVVFVDLFIFRIYLFPFSFFVFVLFLGLFVVFVGGFFFSFYYLSFFSFLFCFLFSLLGF